MDHATLQVPCHAVQMTALERESVISTHFTETKLRLREVKPSAEGHTADRAVKPEDDSRAACHHLHLDLGGSLVRLVIAAERASGRCGQGRSRVSRSSALL